MRRNLLYNEAQWKWVADRFLEGYTARSLSEFLGVHYNTVLRYLHEMGVCKEDRVPLSERKQEFYRLALEDKDENK